MSNALTPEQLDLLRKMPVANVRFDESTREPWWHLHCPLFLTDWKPYKPFNPYTEPDALGALDLTTGGRLLLATADAAIQQRDDEINGAAPSGVFVEKTGAGFVATVDESDVDGPPCETVVEAILAAAHSTNNTDEEGGS